MARSASPTFEHPSQPSHNYARVRAGRKREPEKAHGAKVGTTFWRLRGDQERQSHSRRCQDRPDNPDTTTRARGPEKGKVGLSDVRAEVTRVTQLRAREEGSRSWRQRGEVVESWGKEAAG